jgi:hypothetical protein
MYPRRIAAPHMDYAMHLAIYWQSKDHKSKIIQTKMEIGFGSSILPCPMVADWYKAVEPKFDILGRLRP